MIYSWFEGATSGTIRGRFTSRGGFEVPDPITLNRRPLRPQVRLTYEVTCAGGALLHRELPFVIGVLADLSGQPKQPPAKLADRKFVRIDRDNFDAMLENFQPRVVMRVENTLQGDGSQLAIELNFERLSDFEPAQVACQVGPLAKLVAIRAELKALLVRLEGDDRPEEDLEALLPDLSNQALAAKLMADLAAGRDVFRAIAAWIAELDQALSRQLDAILHHSDFQYLEASWRGLHKLVTSTETGEHLEIRAISVTKKELLRSFEVAAEVHESALWKKVEREFVRGGTPFSVLIGDFAFDKTPPDVALLGQLSYLAAASQAPVVTAPSPEMFGMDSFTEIPGANLLNRFDKDNPENLKWRWFHDSEDSRFVAMVLPRVLRRPPYGADHPIEAFDYQEATDRHGDYCWGNAVYDYAQILTRAFATYRWCAAIRGPEGGGLVENLPVHTRRTTDGDMETRGPTEVALSFACEWDLAELGFIGFTKISNSDRASFFHSGTVQHPKSDDSKEATAVARLAGRLERLLPYARIAHYLRMLCMSPYLGTQPRREDCESFLNHWLSQYVLSNPEDAAVPVRARYPLRAARVDVVEDKAYPGCYQAVLFVSAHFQLDELPWEKRLVFDLSPPGAWPR